MPIRRAFLLSIAVLFFSVTVPAQTRSSSKTVRENTDKQRLQQLEYDWLKAEFKLDTAFLSTLLDDTFIGISANGVLDKQEELRSMYAAIAQRLNDGVFVDSFTLEDVVINLYSKAAVVTFVVHTWGTNKGTPTERKTRFYDVWIKRRGNWKATASQGVNVPLGPTTKTGNQ